MSKKALITGITRAGRRPWTVRAAHRRHVGNAAKANAKLGWKSVTDLETLVATMIDADMKRVARGSQVQQMMSRIA